MTIGIDVRMIQSFPTGIGNYRLSVLGKLLQIDARNKYILIGNKDNVLSPENIEKSVKKNIITSNFSNLYSRFKNLTFAEMKSPANHPLQHLLLPFELRKLKPDLFFTNPWGATLAIPCKYVMEIDDLIYHHFPEFGSFKSKLYEIFLEKILAKKADAVVTISNFVKNDIRHILGVQESKITNIQGSAATEFRRIKDSAFLNNVLEKYKLRKMKYFVYIGNQRPHKNLVNLLKSFEIFKLKLIDDPKFNSAQNISLAIIGGVDAKGRDEDSLRIKAQIEKMKFQQDVHLLGKIFDKNEVAALLNTAIALVHPSLHEGFGMTPLEAMNCGCPVISSNTTAMPEVIGEAGILVDPKNINEIYEAMFTFFTDANLRRELSRKSLERSKMFSWEKTAKMLLEVFLKINK